MLADAPNIQSLWGDLIVEELVRGGVEHFVVCPGSRSTPLVQAVARNPEAHAVIWNDERGAAFHALGIGRMGFAAAVITTSGTAVANLLPAVVEASLDRVPMILLTADRPHELREVGANQSVRQTRMFSDHVRWAFDLQVPDDHAPARSVLTTVDHALYMAHREQHPGPVQLNCPFREPLSPSAEAWNHDCLDGLETWFAGDSPFTTYEDAATTWPTPDEWLEEFAEEMAEVRDGLLVVGDVQHAGAVALVAETLGWPVWSDARVRYAEVNEPPHRMDHVDRLLGPGFSPRIVLQLGSRLTSKRLQGWLDAGGAEYLILVDPAPERLDPGHRVTHRFVAPIDGWCSALAEAVGDAPGAPPEPPPALVARHDMLAAAIEQAVADGDALTEPWVAHHVGLHADPDAAIFASNSMPIRDVQTFGRKALPRAPVFANRGASGIDGIVSTAAGLVRGGCRPVTLLIGDLALLHDLNALLHVQALEHPLTIVVLNNGGGGIFSFLPIAAHEDVLRPYVETPHDVRFEGVCRGFGLAHVRVETRADFEAAYREATRAHGVSVIEVASDIAANKAHHERIEAAIRDALKGA